MSKLKKEKSQLTPDEKKLGKIHVAILVGMIVIGVAIAFYNMQ